MATSAPALQTALTWDDQATLGVSIVCEVEGCPFEIEIHETDAIATARAHMREHLIIEARGRR